MNYCPAAERLRNFGFSRYTWPVSEGELNSCGEAIYPAIFFPMSGPGGNTLRHIAGDIAQYPRRFMRLTFLIILVFIGFQVAAQQLFPVKVEKRWGLIDADGKIALSPVYEAIGEFKRFGYAVMQRDGGVGLLDQGGAEIVDPEYEDLKVLDSTLIEVRKNGVWQVIDLHGQTVLPPGYQRVRVVDNRFLIFKQGEYWGIVDHRGKVIASPRYDEVSFEEQRFFLTRRESAIGLLDSGGKELLPNIAQEISIFSDSLFLYRKDDRWGAVDHAGRELLPPRYDSYSPVSDHFIKLIVDDGKCILYSVPCRRVITGSEYQDFYAFSKKYIIVKKERQLGLVDWCGELVLSPQYAEIQSYHGPLFRVNYRGKWGVVTAGDQPRIPFQYDYIAPLRGGICLVKDGRFYGIANFRGEEVVEPVYDRVELLDHRAKAYKVDDSGRETLRLLQFDEDGQVADNNQFNQHYQVRIGGSRQYGETNAGWKHYQNEYVLDDFEWFYSPEADRWGLRRLDDGGIQIEPVFQYIKTEQDLGFTLVGMESNGRYEFERTTYRFNRVYGLVRNDVGLLVTELEFWDIRLDDFRRGYPVARGIFSNGRHGLVDSIGRVVRRDFAFIGDFHDGVARMSIQGRVSGSMKADHGLGKVRDYLVDMQADAYMVDYTQYDRLFRLEAEVVCEDCRWGYLDTTGKVVVEPRYHFARDFVNEVGIVECNGKWGMVDARGEELIPCRYDGIHFLENTDNRIIRVYIREPKYGLIDTLGQIAVNAVYEEVGSFSDGRLAVRRNGLWGFVDRNGLEVIPCRFREVQNFSEGLAAVKLGNVWGFIDKQGEVEIDFGYLRAGNFKSGLAWVYTNEGAGYIDRKERFVIPTTFDRAYDFHRQVARVMVDNKYGLIDTRGRWILRPRFTDIAPFNQHDLAIVTLSGSSVRYGLINLRGEIITTTAYREIGAFSEGLAAVKDKDSYGFIDTTGRLAIACMYSKVSGFSEGRAAVQKDGACGYITREGEEIVDFAFTKCLDFDGGKAVVYKGIRRAGLVNAAGEMILEPSVDRLLTFQEGRGLVRDDDYRFYYITEQSDLYDGFYQEASAFRHGVAVVQVEGKWGIINQRGIEIIPPKYDKIESFENGFAKVRIKGFNGLSNLKGELIVQPNYEYISYAGEGLFRVEQGDRIGYFDVRGNWVWELNR